MTGASWNNSTNIRMVHFFTMTLDELALSSSLKTYLKNMNELYEGIVMASCLSPLRQVYTQYCHG